MQLHTKNNPTTIAKICSHYLYFAIDKVMFDYKVNKCKLKNQDILLIHLVHTVMTANIKGYIKISVC